MNNKIKKGLAILAADAAVIVGGATLIHNVQNGSTPNEIVPSPSLTPNKINYVSKKNNPNYSVVLNPAPSRSNTGSNTSYTYTQSPTPSSVPSASSTPTASSAPKATPSPLVTQTIYPILPPPPVSGVTSASGSTYTPPPSGGGTSGSPTPRPRPTSTHVEHEGNDH